jgi:hypothetical protein
VNDGEEEVIMVFAFVSGYPPTQRRKGKGKHWNIGDTILPSLFAD